MKKVERPLKQVNQINLTQFIEFSSPIIKTELIFCELQLWVKNQWLERSITWKIWTSNWYETAANNPELLNQICYLEYGF